MSDWFVYVIGPSDGPFKVGCTVDPDRRLSHFQTGHYERLQIHYAVAVEVGRVRRVEARAHRTLAATRLVGEWFSSPLEVVVGAVEAALFEPAPGVDCERPDREHRNYAPGELANLIIAKIQHKAASLGRSVKEHMAIELRPETYAALVMVSPGPRPSAP